MADGTHPELTDDERLDSADDVAELYEQGDEKAGPTANLADGDEEVERFELEDVEDDMPASDEDKKAAY